MKEIVWIALAVAAVMGLRAIQFVAVLVQLLRTSIRPVRIVPNDTPPALSAPEAASVAELESLGFRQIGWGTVERGSHHVATVFFRHESSPAFADLTFLVGGYGGYAVAFYSFGSKGELLVTTNRTGWAFMAPDPQISLVNAYAGSLAAHWQAHLARIQNTATAQVGDLEARQRVAAWTEGYFEKLREARAITQVGDTWHPTLRAAARAAWAWFRARRKLARPYRSDAVGGENQSAFYTHCYLQMEAYQRDRRSRRDVKAWLLALSAMASLTAWGLIFGWGQAVALILILLVHEMGHALAMRAFGYRDMSMFFVPFLGAMVTGVAKELAAWKQVVMLLAGPVPGLFAGLVALIYLDQHTVQNAAFDWQAAATMAVFINLFNLLPITPLDGGQLLELALFSRWPRARLAFAVLGVAGFFALAFWINGPLVWMLAVILAGTMVSQWRIARLQSAWQDGLSEEQQLTHLFEVARHSFRNQSFPRHYALVKSVFAYRRIRQPRAWESAVILLLLVGLWSGVGLTVYSGRDVRAVAAKAEESRTSAQLAFDEAYSNYEDEEADAPGLAELELLGKALDAEDPRQVDLMVLRAQLLQEPERRERMEAILAQGRDGHAYSIQAVARELLWDLYAENESAAPQQRAALLQEEIDRVMHLAPMVYPGTIAARLRVSEALDQGGEPAQALALLNELSEHARRTDDCRCELRGITRAQAWYYITHQEPAQAVALLEAPPYAVRIKQRRESLSVDYAWALLAAGRTAEGLEQMRLAAYSEPVRPSLFQRVRGARERPPLLRHPLDMAYALMQVGRAEEARALIDRDTQWACWQAHENYQKSLFTEPWQEWREVALWKVARAVCPVKQ